MLEFIPSYAWFGLKLVALVVFFIWIRGTLLRLRIDQLTRLAWELLIPLALLNLGNGAFWLLTEGWSAPLQPVRWLISAAVIFLPFVLIGRRLDAGRGTRTYTYAA
jgi:NADH-quinone oxidoreductase subunit H